MTAAGRLAATFTALRQRGERALVPYFTAGDPSLADTGRLVLEAARRGADIVELGVPFSDPLADGPVIQRATQRALAAGVTLPRVLELARELRAESTVPLVFLTYYNPLLAFGLKAFCLTAVECGVDGVIVADLPPEESAPLRSLAEPAGLDLIHLVAPTSTPERVHFGETARTRQKIVECFVLERAEHDLELVLALPRRGAKRRAHAELLLAQAAVQIGGNVEPRAGERTHLDGDVEIIRENRFQPIRRARLRGEAPCATELREIGYGIPIARTLGGEPE